MPKALPLLRGEITYSTAKREEVNILHRLAYPAQRERFFAHILEKCTWIEAIVAHHLNLGSPSLCRMDEAENWYRGSFNFCIPVTINNWKPSEQPGSRVLLRFALPYRVDDVVRPGNGDEKFVARLVPMLGFKKTAPMFQSRSYMALVYLMVKTVFLFFGLFYFQPGHG